MSLTHLNFDVETLGRRENTVILTIACVPFSFENEKSYGDLVLGGFHVKLNLKEQISKYQRTFDPDTVQWWKEQSEEARKNSLDQSPDDVDFEDGLLMLKDFIKASGYNHEKSYVWCRGNYFDFPKLRDAYRQINQEPPYNEYLIRDTRTFIDILTGSARGGYELKQGTPKEFVHHHALHDAALDVKRLQEIYRNIQNGE